MKRIGLYFGSFNPIHIGHLIIAQHFLNNTDLEQVWFVVTPHNPFKPSQTLLNEYHRLHLVHLGIGENPRLKASDVEFHLPKPSYTSATLVYLEEKFPKYTFSLLLGSDSYQNLPRWHNADYILNHYAIYVYERPGYSIEKDSGLEGKLGQERNPGPEGNMTLLKAPLLDISASHIRNLLREKKPITYLVPREVEQECEKNNYYREGPLAQPLP
jgi:nicotinate-nucleotide adenylyltransferase